MSQVAVQHEYEQVGTEGRYQNKAIHHNDIGIYIFVDIGLDKYT